MWRASIFKYLSETEDLFCLTGSELGKEWSKLRDRCLTRAANSKICSKSNTNTGFQGSGHILGYMVDWPLVPELSVTSYPEAPDKLERDLPSRQRLRLGLRGCFRRGMREGGVFELKRMGDTGCEEVREGLVESDDELSAEEWVSSSSHDFLFLWLEGESGGVLVWRPSPTEVERLLLAKELAVWFM